MSGLLLTEAVAAHFVFTLILDDDERAEFWPSYSSAGAERAARTGCEAIVNILGRMRYTSSLIQRTFGITHHSR